MKIKQSFQAIIIFTVFFSLIGNILPIIYAEETNATVIETNATVIETNATVIGTNATVIGTNATVIGTNATVIGTNATVIETNATVIETNATVTPTIFSEDIFPIEYVIVGVVSAAAIVVAIFKLKSKSKKASRVFCGKCGANIVTTSTFCRKCGNKLPK